MFRPGRMGRRVTAVSERIFPELRAIDAAAAAEDVARTKSPPLLRLGLWLSSSPCSQTCFREVFRYSTSRW